MPNGANSIIYRITNKPPEVLKGYILPKGMNKTNTIETARDKITPRLKIAPWDTLLWLNSLITSITGWIRGGPYRLCILAMIFLDKPRKNTPAMNARSGDTIIWVIFITIFSTSVE
jgi:hypothetical protein